MKKGIERLLAAPLAIIALSLASCSPALITTAPVTSGTTSAPATAAPLTTAVAPAEGPKYGGVVNIALTADISYFDESLGLHASCHTVKLTNEELLTGDWAKGPAGTNDTDWSIRGLFRWEQKTGSIAESWDFSQPGTMVFHIRRGIHYGLNPNSEASRLVNGRELTADDVAFTFNYYLNAARAWIRVGTIGPTRAAQVSVTAPDKWTVVIKVPVDLFGDSVIDFSDFASIIPPEVVNKYGNIQDWRNAVGTGPFMLTDFVPGSSATLVKNSKYWGRDPVGPGKSNALPYVDGVKYLIITDLSTREAAFRAAKVDLYLQADWEASRTILKALPQVANLKYDPDTGVGGMHMRTDKSPFNDKKVRRALLMATDFQSMKKDLFGGEALIISWPKCYRREYKNAYLTLEEAPASVQELYTYSPDKAKGLLTEAGYPNGFKTSVICSTDPTVVDYFSVVKTMWAKVGVDLTIDKKEPAVLSSIQNLRSHEAMITGATSPMGGLYKCVDLWGVSFTNCSYIDDPYVMKVREQMQNVWIANPAEADKIHKEFMKYVLDQAWVIPKPMPPLYNIWWPWVKNYHGELSIGYDNTHNYAKYVWVDQELKQKMTGGR